MMMSENYKIIAKFIKDMSSETPDTETYIFVKENIFKYQLGININSKPLKNQVIEINTNLKTWCDISSILIGFSKSGTQWANENHIDRYLSRYLGTTSNASTIRSSCDSKGMV